MPNPMTQVAKMHEEFGIDYKGPPRTLSPEEFKFRMACMQEELDEYSVAPTLVDQFDALMDLSVFVLGTAYRQGLPFYKGFDAVMKANMRKKVGGNAKRGNFSIDLVKPKGFVGPEEDLGKIIREAYANVR